jgi:CRISPR-associated exonuclease Cas4
MPTFSDLSQAAYCPRQLYYARSKDDREPPAEAKARQELAFRYPELLAADDEVLAELPIECSPTAYREALRALSRRSDWEALSEPDTTEYFVEGKDCHGLIHKLLAGDPPVPTIVSPGKPPANGVWEPQAVRAVAVANALAWERQREIPRTLVEYPATGVVREVDLTCRRTAAYRRTLRTVRSMDGPPPRVNDSRCESCDYRTECGVTTRSLKSLLGL